MIAHQRRVREEAAGIEPRPPLSSLKECRIEPIGAATARPLILRYEWLGTLNKPTMIIGGYTPEDELFGVAAFGRGLGTGVRTRLEVSGEKTLCLERGACTHWAHPHAASWLINRACRAVRDLHGARVFYAYADPSAGELGTVYQSSSWYYLGKGLGHGRARYSLRPPWVEQGDFANYHSTRVLRHSNGVAKGLSTFAEARAAGWSIEMVPSKHLYVIHVGSSHQRRNWLRKLVASGWEPQPYPKERGA